MKTNQNQKEKNPAPSPSRLHKVVRPQDPVLRFSPTAWAKLLYFRDRGDTEIGGFAITDPQDLLYVREFTTVKQTVSFASVSFEDEAVADYFEDQAILGRKPEQFARIWLHTHPGDSPQPSGTDEETFDRVFGRCDWAVMAVVAQAGKTYARLRFNVGPGGAVLIPVAVDYSLPFCSSDQTAWEAEYRANIKAHAWLEPCSGDQKLPAEKKDSGSIDSCLASDLIEQLEELDPMERQVVLEELAIRPDLWGSEREEVFYE